MSDAGEAIKRRFGRLALLRVDVPELAGALEPAALWCRPYTLRDQESLPVDLDSPEAWAEVWLRMALREDGSPMFDRADKGALMDCLEADILQRYGMVMIVGLLPEASGDADCPEQHADAAGNVPKLIGIAGQGGDYSPKHDEQESEALQSRAGFR